MGHENLKNELLNHIMRHIEKKILKTITAIKRFDNKRGTPTKIYIGEIFGYENQEIKQSSEKCHLNEKVYFGMFICSNSQRCSSHQHSNESTMLV